MSSLLKNFGSWLFGETADEKVSFFGGFLLFILLLFIATLLSHFQISYTWIAFTLITGTLVGIPALVYYDPKARSTYSTLRNDIEVESLLLHKLYLLVERVKRGIFPKADYERLKTLWLELLETKLNETTDSLYNFEFRNAQKTLGIEDRYFSELDNDRKPGYLTPKEVEKLIQSFIDLVFGDLNRTNYRAVFEAHRDFGLTLYLKSLLKDEHRSIGLEYLESFTTLGTKKGFEEFSKFIKNQVTEIIRNEGLRNHKLIIDKWEEFQDSIVENLKSNKEKGYDRNVLFVWFYLRNLFILLDSAPNYMLSNNPEAQNILREMEEEVAQKLENIVEALGEDELDLVAKYLNDLTKDIEEYSKQE